MCWVWNSELHTSDCSIQFTTPVQIAVFTLTTPVQKAVFTLTTPVQISVFTLTTPVQIAVFTLTTPVQIVVLTLTTPVQIAVFTLTTPVQKAIFTLTTPAEIAVFTLMTPVQISAFTLTTPAEIAVFTVTAPVKISVFTLTTEFWSLYSPTREFWSLSLSLSRQNSDRSIYPYDRLPIAFTLMKNSDSSIHSHNTIRNVILIPFLVFLLWSTVRFQVHMTHISNLSWRTAKLRTWREQLQKIISYLQFPNVPLLVAQYVGNIFTYITMYK